MRVGPTIGAGGQRPCPGYRRHLVHDLVTLLQILLAMAALVTPVIVGVRLLDRDSELYA